jgi:hypothetical protein
MASKTRSQSKSSGKPAVPREQWAKTDIHRHSTYFCGICGKQHPDPEAVYACIDSHRAHG